MNKKISLVALIEVSFFAAFALILDLIVPSIKLSPSISISFAMVPIFILAMRWGIKVSLIAGFLWGTLQVVTGDAWIVTPVQAIMEYFIAFSFIGFAGLFYPIVQKHLRSGKKGNAVVWIVLAVFAGSVARYFWHFLAGVIFIEHFAPGIASPVLFSLTANGLTMLGTFVLCSIITVTLLTTAPRLVIRQVSRTSLRDKRVS
ncbi:energy-coupled thiamine transporter ThiT [Cytobacillus horneckiae]|uniref:energy-coupled thiamine transporter ThiT n=1 Tax=Cytobacillus horneckiae TaxID=549687 RepID=UPI003D9A62F0